MHPTFDASTQAPDASMTLFTQGGKGECALTRDDILEPSEVFRGPMDCFAHAPQTIAMLQRLAQEKPTTLACMHGSAWQGVGERLLLDLGRSVQAGLF